MWGYLDLIDKYIVGVDQFDKNFDGKKFENFENFQKVPKTPKIAILTFFG